MGDGKDVWKDNIQEHRLTTYTDAGLLIVLAVRSKILALLNTDVF
jgi:hypothetical protein